MSPPLVQLRRPGQADLPVVEGEAPVATVTHDRLAYVETYGCQMNVADTEMVLGMLAGAGYGRTTDPARADVILLNTCAVREKAEDRIYGRVKALAHLKKKKNVVLGVTGCMAEHLKGKLQENAPAVDLVIGPDGYRRLLEHIDRARTGQSVQDTVLDRHETYEGLDPDRQMTGGVTGHITIQRGCDKFCTFCIVPYTRGRERGAAPREILRQAHAMAAAGYKEIQLLGQTVNSYRYEDVTFADLLRAVAKVDGIERIRFTSPYPLDFSDEVIAAMAETDKVCNHVHLPLQSGSNAMLERMRRGYSYETFVGLVQKLRAAMPNIGISTDLMVGFCDETDEEFQATMKAVQEIRFDNAFMFAYSEREGTVAARKMPDTVPEALKQSRLSELIAVQRRINAQVSAAAVGTRQRVLVEAVSKRSADEFLARTETFQSVIIPGQGLALGDLLTVDIMGTTSATLIGVPVSSS